LGIGFWMVGLSFECGDCGFGMGLRFGLGNGEFGVWVCRLVRGSEGGSVRMQGLGLRISGVWSCCGFRAWGQSQGFGVDVCITEGDLHPSFL
jgi:hypothetical protein